MLQVDSIAKSFFTAFKKCRPNPISKIALVILLNFNFGMVYANDFSLTQEMQTFKISTENSRVIYSPSSSGASLTVTNPQNYPMLVQSEVLKSNKTEKAPFIVTPPLFRLDGHQKNRLRIVAYGDTGPNDRESLDWICMTGIPPEADSSWTQKNGNSEKEQSTLLTQLRVKSCIKLFVRPESLKGTSADAASRLVWKKSGSVITVSNPTPFYMNFRKVEIGKSIVTNPGYAPPFGELTIRIDAGVAGIVKWSQINDFGGDTHQFTSNIS